MNMHSVANANELSQALADAKGGDRIECAPNEFGNLRISPVYSSRVVLTSKDHTAPAQFKNIELTNAAFLTLRNLKSIGDGINENSKGIEIIESDHCALENSEVLKWGKCVTFLRSTNGKAWRNNVHSHGVDAFNITANNGLLVEENWVHHPGRLGSHQDCFQVWNTTSGPARNYDIIGNFCDFFEATHAHHGFLFKNEEFEKTGDPNQIYENIKLEENMIYGAHVNGINVGATNGLVIGVNTFLRNPDVSADGNGTGDPRINMKTGYGAVDILDNLTTGELFGPREEFEPHWNISGTVALDPADAANIASEQRVMMKLITGPQVEGSSGVPDVPGIPPGTNPVLADRVAALETLAEGQATAFEAWRAAIAVIG